VQSFTRFHPPNPGARRDVRLPKLTRPPTHCFAIVYPFSPAHPGARRASKLARFSFGAAWISPNVRA